MERKAKYDSHKRFRVVICQRLACGVEYVPESDKPNFSFDYCRQCMRHWKIRGQEITKPITTEVQLRELKVKEIYT